MGAAELTERLLTRRRFLRIFGRAGLPFALSGILVGAPEAQQQAGPAEVHHIHGLAIGRRNPEVVYVATHTGLVRIQPKAAPEWVGSHRHDLMGFTAHPHEPNLVYASGHPDAATYRQLQTGNLGLLVSRDGGKTWQSVALKGDADFHALAYTPRNGGQLYGWSVAGETGLHRISTTSWKVERLRAEGLSNVWSLAASPEPAGPLLAGTKSGLMVSRDAGSNWSRVTKGIRANMTVTAVSFHTSDPTVVYAYMASADRGLMRSRDGGATWESAGYVGDPRAPVVVLAVGPGEHVALAATNSNVLRSSDGGRSWQPILERGRPVTGSR